MGAREPPVVFPRDRGRGSRHPIMNERRDGQRDELAALRAEVARLRERLGVGAEEPRGASAPLFDAPGASASAPGASAAPTSDGLALSELERKACGFVHDFNNLILVMMGSTDLALALLPEDSPARRPLLSVKTTARQSEKLCKQMLTLAHRSSSRPPAIDLKNAVEDELELLAHTAGDQIDLVTRMDEGRGWANMDLGEFEQLLFNLVLNARDALDGKGRIEIELRRLDSPAQRRVSSSRQILSSMQGGVSSSRVDHPPGSWMVLRVMDAGAGMTAETLEQAFSPFFTTKPVGRGTGLGLTLCQEIVARSGGFLDVQSSVGEGTRVSAYLPRIDDSEAPLPGASGSEDADQVERRAAATILLVDDEPAVRSALKAGLSRTGIEVIEAGTGEEALTAIERFRSRIDMIVSDLTLPDTEGLELVEAALRQVPDLHWLFISGRDLSSAELHFVEHEAGGHLRKPFTPDFLSKEILHALEAPGSARADMRDPVD